jgi:prepilin-type N-terminal cleavage/methylation domain-containing protein
MFHTPKTSAPILGTRGSRTSLSHASAKPVQRQAMTLLEVILAITISALILTAAISLVVSISTIWMEREERLFFNEHVDGVTEFLQATINRASQEIGSAGRASTRTAISSKASSDAPADPLSTVDQTESSLIQASSQPLKWERPPGFAQLREPLLRFELTHKPPLLVDCTHPSRNRVIAYFYFKPSEGLSLLWYAPQQITIQALNDLRRTQVSPWLTHIKYIYWDDARHRWETLTHPNKDQQQQLPRYLELTFEYQAEVSTRTLTIPSTSQRVIIF